VIIFTLLFLLLLLFFIPNTFNQAGVSDYPGPAEKYSDKFRDDEENNYPACEDRQFTFDNAAGTTAFCYCNFHKWRCTEDLNQGDVKAGP